MMRQYELVERVRRYNPETDEDLLNRAYVFAMKAHGAQKRASGDPFFSHPLEVAAILTDLKLDDATIVSAVLHDTIEDTAATREEIDSVFGPEIGGLVEGLTKLNKLDFASKHAQQAENFRKLLLAIADDARVLLIKLADRLHNMRTLNFMPEAKRARIAQDTLDIYAPLAGRMGMQGMRSELEDLAFRCLMPDAYGLIVARLEELKTKNGALIARIAAELTDQFARRGIKVEVKGRQKQAYSIWRKMERHSIAFEQLSDIYGFRILVDTVADCYAAVGVAHTTWPSVPGRFKDYISTPKQNDYRSIHTTVIGPGSQRVELQIRTHDMHEIAEYGIAAHALYKDRHGRPEAIDASESRAYRGLRQTIETLASDDSEKFLEHTKLELFQDQVFCFTPKGRLIALPRGATAIDFAYAVHTDVGNSAVGAKINGRIAPLISTLRNGDEVLITRSDSRTPPAAWDSLVVTGRARAAIRRATREAAKAQYGGLGRQIIERAFARAGRKFSDAKLKSALSRLARSSRRRRVHQRRARRTLFGRRRARDLSRFQGGAQSRAGAGARRKRLVRPGQGGQSGLSRARQGRERRRVAAARRRMGHAGAIRAQGRRRAGRTHRRHPHAGGGDHDLSHPFARARRLRRQAGAMARRALGSRHRDQGALPDANPGDDAQRAGRARSHRDDDRGSGRQHRQRRVQSRPGRIFAKCASTWKSPTSSTSTPSSRNCATRASSARSSGSAVEEKRIDAALFRLWREYGRRGDGAALSALQAAGPRAPDAPSARGHARGLADGDARRQRQRRTACCGTSRSPTCARSIATRGWARASTSRRRSRSSSRAAPSGR